MLFRYFLAGAMILHGLAHLSGFLASWTTRDSGFKDEPWLFSQHVRLRSSLGRIFGLVWLLAALLLTGAGIALLVHPAWFSLPAAAGSLASLVAILPWWKAVVPGARVGAVFDILILLLLLSPWGSAVLL